MKYLIFGNGYLAHKFKDYFEDSVIELTNINDEAAVAQAIEKHRPEAVINCAARTGRPNIDWCEDHKLETLDSNLRGPLSLLKVCAERGQYWVQIGSGCIYQGDNEGRGWSEDDAPNFTGSYYSWTKAAMNEALRPFGVLQLRLRMPLDAQPGPRNFITKIASYPKVISIPNSITVVDDFIEAAGKLMDKKAVGIYNMVNPGAIEHKEIMDMYREIVDNNHRCEFISLKELEKMTAAPRSNCVLSSRKLENEGISLPDIHQRVSEILKKYKDNLDNGYE